MEFSIEPPRNIVTRVVDNVNLVFKIDLTLSQTDSTLPRFEFPSRAGARDEIDHYAVQTPVAEVLSRCLRPYRRPLGDPRLAQSGGPRESQPGRAAHRTELPSRGEYGQKASRAAEPTPAKGVIRPTLRARLPSGSTGRFLARWGYRAGGWHARTPIWSESPAIPAAKKTRATW
jgi:hypothetical protein